MSQFYLTLPSNSSMKFYPNNTLTSYTTHLQTPISLSGDWEVGLVEIQYPYSWYNLQNNENRIVYRQDGHRPVDLMIQPGYYDSPSQLLDQINWMISVTATKQGSDKFPVFKYNELTKRVSATIRKDTLVSFSSTLASMLGVGERQNPVQNELDVEDLPWYSRHACDVHRGFHSMYVYCDVLEHVPVGDTRAPLLRIVNVRGSNGESIYRIYDKPLYVPLQKKNFESLEIDIRTDTGIPVPFEYGKVVVTLHFRLCKSSYFLQ